MKIKTLDFLQDIENDKQKKILLQIHELEQDIKEYTLKISDKENKYSYVYNNRLTPKYLIKSNCLYLEKLNDEIKNLKQQKIFLENELNKLKDLLAQNFKDIKKYDILRNKENLKIKEEMKLIEERVMQDIYMSLYNKKTNRTFD